MSKHDHRFPTPANKSFNAASLKLDPSLIAIACHLARIAAENDYKNLPPREKILYTPPDKKGGPQ
jgi:hypothetical protein